MASPYFIQSISQLHQLLRIDKPDNPLVSVIDFSQITCFSDEQLRSVIYNFYCIALKKNFQGKMRYGQNTYDFDEGVMTFFAPGQVVTTEIVDDLRLTGWWLVMHPDFVQDAPLARKIKTYDYFSYAVHEALHLSAKEETILDFIVSTIKQEIGAAIDTYSYDIISSQIQVLLDYCARFYNRQFISRKLVNKTSLARFEDALNRYVNSALLAESGPPSVQYLADQLAMSPSYLSSMLRSLTGQNAQQHIHNRLIEKAKELLITTELTVSEVAYLLGFAHAQSFNKLFKNKTRQSPLRFRSVHRLH